MDEGMGHEQDNQIEELQKQLTVITSLPSLNEAQVGDIGGRLGSIYRDAEQLGDVALMTTVADTWAIIQANPTTTAIAAGAISGLIEAVQQRDSALDELGRLEDGINELESEGETRNPRLRGAAHVLYETLRERWEDEQADAYFDMECPGCRAVEMGWDTEDDHDNINMLYGTLFGGLNDMLPKELIDELRGFMTVWGEKVSVFLDGKRNAS